MSDGNFNRSLLPHTPYQSGIRMGKSVARKYAMEAFRNYLLQRHPNLSEETVMQEIQRFDFALSQYTF